MRCLLVVLAGMLAACAASTGSDVRSVRLVLDVGLLAGTLQGDFNSVIDRAELAITDAGGTDQQTMQLDQGVFDPVFDVEVEEGEVTFAVVVRNAAGTALYQGSTTTTIDADGFNVTIVPVPVNPVLVATPRNPTFTISDNSIERTFTYNMRVRNPGTDGLIWRVDQVTLPQGWRLVCRLPTFDGVSCLVNRTWDDGQDEPIQVQFIGPTTATSPPGTGIRFVSDNSGTFTVPTP